MEEWSWVVSLVGAGVVILVLVDVLLTVLHIDTDGPLASKVFHVVWRPLAAASRSFPSWRRSLIALAGPVIIAAIFVVWVGVFVLGFALLYWPFMGFFRADQEYALLGFAEAVYFSGVTATVLGYGDLTPMTASLQVLSFVQAGLGFAMLTGIVTYLINVVAGIADRNALAARLWNATGRTGEGSDAIVRSLASEGSEGLHLRLHLLLPSVEKVHQQMHQFPVLDLFYRSRNPIYAPEIMLRSLAHVAFASRLAAADDSRFGSLTPISEELIHVAEELAKLVAAQHLDSRTQDMLDEPKPGPDDARALERMHEALVEGVPGIELRQSPAEAQLLEGLCRTRVLLDALDDLTMWRMDIPVGSGDSSPRTGPSGGHAGERLPGG